MALTNCLNKMKISGKEYCLMLYDRQDEPIAYFENYKEASAYLGSSKETIMCAILRHEGRMRRDLLIRKVEIESEEN